MQHLSAACQLLLAVIADQAGAASSSASAPRRLARSIDTTHVEIVDAGGRRARLARGERHGDWTLMHVAAGSIARRLIEAHITLPAGIPSPTKLRLRVPGELPVRSVAIDGEDWRAFDATTETVDLPAHPRGALHVRVRY